MGGVGDIFGSLFGARAEAPEEKIAYDQNSLYSSASHGGLQFALQQQAMNQQMQSCYTSTITGPYQTSWGLSGGDGGVAGNCSAPLGHAVSMTSTPPYDPSFQKLTQKDIDSEAYNTPIQDLVNLWTLRFGNGWVVRSDVVTDEFYSLAAQRLLKLGRMEECYLADKAHTVLRISE